MCMSSTSALSIFQLKMKTINQTEIISAFRLGISALTESNHYNGFYGISASYPFFSNEPLEEYCKKYYNHKCVDEFIEFGAHNFNSFLVVLVDYLLHYNLMAFSDMNSNQAKNTAEKVGDILEKRIQETINKHGDEIIFSRWKNIEKDQDFKNILEIIKNYMYKNPKFNKECTDLTISGTWNKLKTIRSKHGIRKYKQALSIAKNYSLEDIALDLYLFKDFPIEISKYEPPSIIKNIYNGLFPGLEEKLELSLMGHIQLSFNKDPVYSDLYDDEWVDIKNERNI